MTPPPPTAKELFLDALELPASERATFVRRACGTDGELAARVDRLLRAHEGADELLEPGLPGELRRSLREGVLNVARRLGLERS